MALLESQIVTFWDSPVSTLKKSQTIFWQPRPFPPQPQQQQKQLGEMVGCKGDLAASSSDFCSSPKDLPHAFPLPADPSTAHPLASPSNALWIACHQSTTRKRPWVFPKSRWVKSRCCCGRRCSRRAASSPGRHHGGHHSSTAPALQC